MSNNDDHANTVMIDWVRGYHGAISRGVEILFFYKIGWYLQSAAPSDINISKYIHEFYSLIYPIVS